MKIIVGQITASVEAEEKAVFAMAKKRLRGVCAPDALVAPQVYRRSVDARKRDSIKLVYSVIFDYTGKKPDEKRLQGVGASFAADEIPEPKSGCGTLTDRPVIVGFGPCGMFCALLLAEQGYRPIVVERGDEVYKRAEKVEHFYKTGHLDPDSNIQFGAGGAGTFSDGKLVTRISDSRCRYVLTKFREFGAAESVLTAAKPHVGTDVIRQVVSNLAARIEALGGTILYNTRMDGIVTEQGRAKAIVTNAGEIPCGALVLAVGHSARDTYRYLMRSNFSLSPKPFSVGVRIEHLTEDIDRALYGDLAGDPRLGHAEYNLSAHFDGVGVYTFCMCPGGEVMAAASEEGGVVVNGMSYAARDGRNSNAAVAVSVTHEDPMAFQRMLEERAYQAGGGQYAAPVQTVGDFLSGTRGTEPNRVMPTHKEGCDNAYTLCDLNAVLPEQISSKLKLGLENFDRKIKGYAAADAVLTGVESRTSAPYRILRRENFLALGFDNIYPCGEGAGYAGGITSAAVDGIHCAEQIIERYACPE